MAAAIEGAAQSGTRGARAEPTAVPRELVETAPTIVRLCRLFQLSAFERDLVLACLGAELDPELARRCATALHSPGSHRPTLSLALSAFPDGHLGSLAPSSPLRRHRIVMVAEGVPLFAAPIALDERIVYFLLGVPDLDPVLASSLTEVVATTSATTRGRLVERVRATCAHAAGDLVVGLTGSTSDERRAVAAATCQALGSRLFRVSATDLPGEPGARYAYRQRWEREARLLGATLLVEVDAQPEAVRNATALLDELGGRALVSSREPLQLARSSYTSIELRREASLDRLAHWHHALGATAAELGRELDRIAAQFALPPAAISRACLSIEGGDGPPGERLWDACREQARPRLDDLATRIEPIAAWDDLVVPAETRAQLEAISSHVRHRFEVYERWGFAARSSRGLGSGALFVGASGTGKTLAAEVLAREARLDLYHIDLSQIVNKYVGETEKNLRRVFDAAEEGGAILLFDEADALFGKRGEVEKGTDRYANLEVSYLLQRMESYRGLAILTTNQRDALDTAFCRRLRFIVTFPFPDVAERIGLWERAFPASAPVGALDLNKLARLKLPGGHIRNIAVNAAFVAAEVGQPISMAHLLHAARAEFRKLERPFPEGDVVGWLS
ncbi:MAG: ATP-binding protein [Kofleriaceae bacterium]